MVFSRIASINQVSAIITRRVTCTYRDVLDIFTCHIGCCQQRTTVKWRKFTPQRRNVFLLKVEILSALSHLKLQ